MRGQTIKIIFLGCLFFGLMPARLFAEPNCSNVSPDHLSFQVDLVSAAYSVPQSMVALRVEGKDLSPYNAHTVVLCYLLPTGAHATADYIRFDPGSDPTVTNKTTMGGTLSILPTAPNGVYRIFLSDGTKLFDTNKNFTVRSDNDGQYSDCPIGSGPVATNKDLYCSQALLDYDQAKQIFGKGVADRYIITQVNVRNLSEDYEYVLHDIRIGTTEAVVASIDRRLVRGLAEKTEQFSARAIAIRLSEAGATMLTGIGGVVENELLKDAASLTAGPALLGLKHAIPDLTVQEKNRIDDLAFSANAIVIPKHAAAPMVVFLSSHIFNSGFKTLTQAQLLEFQQNLIVQVAGAHVLEIKVPTVTSITPSTLDQASATKSGTEILTLQGTSLDAVKTVHLKPQGSGDSVSITPEKTTDTTKLQVKISSNDAGKLKVGKYSIVLDTAAKDSISTSTTFEVVSQASTAAPTVEKTVSGSPLDPSALAKNSVTIGLTGTHLDTVTKVHLKPQQGDGSLAIDPEKTKDPTKLEFKLNPTDATQLKAPNYAISLDTQSNQDVQTSAILEVTQPATSPSEATVTHLSGSPLSIAKLAKDDATVDLGGTALDTVKAVYLKPQGVDAAIPVTFNKTVDPTKLQVKIDKSLAKKLKPAEYSIVIDTSAKSGIATKVSIKFEK